MDQEHQVLLARGVDELGRYTSGSGLTFASGDREIEAWNQPFLISVLRSGRNLGG